ncbi:hypothetical protein FRB95_008242 [Tulasnella sp. JGI-2019a]|nr:hypothetical protein FRB95_008242 [Tulasnella sp. JGI-2019a]
MDYYLKNSRICQVTNYASLLSVHNLRWQVSGDQRLPSTGGHSTNKEIIPTGAGTSRISPRKSFTTTYRDLSSRLWGKGDEGLSRIVGEETAQDVPIFVNDSSILPNFAAQTDTHQSHVPGSDVLVTSAPDEPEGSISVAHGSSSTSKESCKVLDVKGQVGLCPWFSEMLLRE